MDTRLKIPEAAILAIKNQRYQEFLQAKNPLDVYDNDITLLQKYVHEGTRHILDIGCGIGLTSLLLFERLNRRDIKFYLFDKNFKQPDQIKKYYRDSDFYFEANFELSKTIIQNSGLPEENFIFVEASPEALGQLPTMDLIFSFAAWGMHFPVSLYKNEVSRLCKSGTHLICDLRVDELTNFREGEKSLTDSLKAFPDILRTSGYRHVGNNVNHVPLENFEAIGSKIKCLRFLWTAQNDLDYFTKS